MGVRGSSKSCKVELWKDMDRPILDPKSRKKNGEIVTNEINKFK